MNKTDIHYDAVIVGLGKTGMSCVRYLSKQGLTIAVTDTRSEPPELATLKDEYQHIPVYLDELNVEILLAAEQIILSPGISLQDKAIKRAIDKGIPVYGDVELFCQQAEAPVIAITGSNGKSTVTTLVAEMTKRAGIKTAVGGNLGTPALDLINEDAELYVLELSSFQLETTFSLNAHASVVLNISADHMDRYASFEDYAMAKQKIYSGNGLLVINQDDPIVNAMADKNGNASRKQINFTLNEATQEDFGLIKENDDVWLCQGDKRIIKQSELLIQGEHNVANALAAMALTSSMSVSQQVMADTLREFNGLPHRCQRVSLFKNVAWYNDSKATNVGSCIASIVGLSEFGKIVLIAGGDSKGADLSDLTAIIKQFVKHVVLLGSDAKKLAAIIHPETPVTFVSDMDEAVKTANAHVCKNEQVLLAPACASLDMYDNYQQRGDDFIAAVRRLEQD